MTLENINKDPYLTDLEVEEAYEYMKDHSINDIDQVWLKLFLRSPSRSELSAFIKRLQEGGPIRHEGTLFYVQTNKIADAYRFRYGPFFSLRKANRICKSLFNRNITHTEAIEVKKLIKESDPFKMTKLYEWIAEEVDLIQQQKPTWKLEDLYKKFVLRPPYRFEIHFHNENP